MFNSFVFIKRRAAARSLREKNSVFYILPLLLLALLILKRECASLAAERAVRFCALSLVPSLFPFAVLSRLIFGQSPPRYLSFITTPFSYIIGVSRAAVVPLFFGLFCGFPMGAFSAHSLYERGEISKKDLMLVSFFANNAGYSYIFGVVRDYSSKLSFVIFISQIVVSLLLIRLFSFFIADEWEYRPLPTENKGTRSFALDDAVFSAASAMLLVSALTVFFSVVCEIIRSTVSLPQTLFAALAALLEISCGFLAAGALPPPASYMLISALCAFGGLSVHMQTAGILKGSLPFYKLILARVLYSALVLALSALLLFY